VKLFDRITVKGLVSEGYDGPRLRMRNCLLHSMQPNDVAILAEGTQVFLSLLRK